MAAVGLVGGPAAGGAEKATAHLVGQEAAAWAKDADATQVADSATRQTGVTFLLQPAGCPGLDCSAFGSLTPWVRG